MENYRFDTYRGNKKGEIMIESKYEQSAVKKVRIMHRNDLKELIDREIETDTNSKELLVFYNGELIRKI